MDSDAPEADVTRPPMDWAEVDWRKLRLYILISSVASRPTMCSIASRPPGC